MKKVFLFLFIGGIVMSLGCLNKESNIYDVTRLTSEIKIDARWDKSPWSEVQALPISRYMGDKPAHIPHVQAKVLWDKEAIYVIFRVEDNYVRAVTTRYQGPVYRDSCVEFFFTPGTDISFGYFNLEVNCGGTALFNFQKKPREDVVSIPEEDFQKIVIAHTMPKKVEPEIESPVVWAVEYRIPYKILKEYTDVTPPSPGVEWRANFYKCADLTSHPHWLTWSPVNFPRPNFHLPEFFGTLVFK
ncbi:carbohydrate-binding family 9-like protein [Acidobacteriota bacterium]